MYKRLVIYKLVSLSRLDFPIEDKATPEIPSSKEFHLLVLGLAAVDDLFNTGGLNVIRSDILPEPSFLLAEVGHWLALS